VPPHAPRGGSTHRAAALAEFRALDPALKRTVMAHAVEAMSVSDDLETFMQY